MGFSTSVKLLLFVMLLGLASRPALDATEPNRTNLPGLSPGDYEPNLPVIFLDATQPIGAEQKVPCTLKIVYPKGAARGDSGSLPGAVKVHGGVSRGHPKKSFSVGLDRPAQLLDMRQHAHWLLNAAYIDRSLMRHKLSFDLFRSLSSSGSKRSAVASRFVEVYLNGRYNGAYLLMERVDRQLLGLRSYHSNDLSPTCIYKAIDHAANFGGLGHSGYEQREPAPALRPYWEPLQTFNRFVVSAKAEAFSDPQTGIGARLDLDNAIDFHLLVLLTSNGDGITKNYFLARNGQAPGSPSQRFFFAPWDYDGTFGRNWDAGVVGPSDWLSNHLFDRLLAGSAYREKFVARWNHLRQDEFSVKKIHGLIDQYARTLGAAARRNALRWPTGAGPYPDQLSFEEDLAQMKAWTEARLKWLDQQINHHLDQ